MPSLQPRRFFEFEDLKWFPDFIRRSMLDYLNFIFSKSDLYAPAAPLILKCIEKSNATAVLDTCSGGGGPMLEMEKYIHQHAPGISITLSDRFPNIVAFKSIHESSGGRIGFIETSVDACQVPEHLRAVRTCFSALHHFDPVHVKNMLLNAVQARQAIAIFDGGGNKFMLILGILIVHPIILFFCTPFLRPFRLSRLVFTYLIPIIPLCIMWDGIVSILNLYSKEELELLIRSTDDHTFSWEAGEVQQKAGMKVSYLAGYPI